MHRVLNTINNILVQLASVFVK